MLYQIVFHQIVNSCYVKVTFHLFTSSYGNTINSVKHVYVYVCEIRVSEDMII